MTALQTPLPPTHKDTYYNLGLVLYALSACLFLFTMDSEETTGDPFTSIFFFNYGAFVLYLVIVLMANKERYGKRFRFKGLRYNILLLLLANISAYSLNRSLPVFDESTPWLVGLLVALNIALLLHSLGIQKANQPLKLLLVIIMSVAWLFNLYEMFYVIPFYVFGLLGFWFFGLSLHTFVPLWFSILLGKILWKYHKEASVYRYAILAGWLIPLGMLAFFSFRWAQIDHLVEQAYHHKTNPFEHSELPKWVEVSRRLPKDWITKRALKSGLVFKEAGGLDFDFGLGGGRSRTGEKPQHDPLVTMASFFNGKIELNGNEKVRLLNTVFDTRHETERRLWSGDHLVTKNIITNVQLFPQYRLAYTEKELTIQNTFLYNQNRPEEAIYTFYLPEGAAVTSASLWIDGVEQPSYLTTKDKADNAYRTIVGRERRDPLLIHWQEGNRLSLRVFPCTPNEHRRFKIGITSPLKNKEGRQYYENIDFKGPFWKSAKEQINIGSSGSLGEIDSNLSLQEQGNSYTYNGRYRSDWKLSIPAEELSPLPFVFNGQQYSLNASHAPKSSFNAKEVYLDIHSGWSRREFNKVWSVVKDKEVYVFTGMMVRLTEGNRHVFFKRLRKHNFSLFPIHQIKNPADALLITAHSQLTPTLKDLKNSHLSNKLIDFVETAPPAIRTYNLDEEWTPYMGTLKEFRLLLTDNGTISRLKSLLRKQQFKANEEDEDTVMIPGAGIKIRQTEAAGGGGEAPDHLLRLFAYNRILQQAAPYYFSGVSDYSNLIELAEKAHVLSPVSSLVVLETQKDYDRFDIKKSNNSLGNASIKASGSVPEPHEWLLIILSLFTAIWLMRKEIALRFALFTIRR